MKLKLRTQSTDLLNTCLSQISYVRKYVTLRFTPQQLCAILVNSSAVALEPQIWCKFPMHSLFYDVEILSLRDNVIMLEINIEQFLQAIRNFNKASLTDLSLRLQRKEGKASLRAAYLTLYYSDVSANSSTINRTFRLPVRITKDAGDVLKEPELPRIDLMMKLPRDFSAVYKRLDKFRNSTAQDQVSVQASRRQGGYVRFVLLEADTHKTTIKWNDKLDVLKPAGTVDTDSLHAGLQELSRPVDENDASEDCEVSVRLHDWRMAAKIVSTCKTVIMLMCHETACVIHCLLDDMEDVEVVYYISGVRGDPE